ncbi:uncharacterized protein LOC126264863 [Aethina tumida]|uniref:uncharacterized protein LOC126264863 n=1 Tax=Aethina tumida TaxID=116153 RepID=UPI00214949E9|nr:uncharacterized protein LOC126264863 [Aethina tumida]
MKMVETYFIFISLIIIVLFAVPISVENRTLEPTETPNTTTANSSDIGTYIGAYCVSACSVNLLHVYCNPRTNMCSCEKSFPVKLNPHVGCGEAKRLGDQCYYKETCQYTDQYSSCIQIHHNAVCQCIDGYHSVSLQKPSVKMFCSKDIVIITTDFRTFVGVLAGIAVLTGLICFTLHLFNQNLYENHHSRFGNTNLTLFADNSDRLEMPIAEQSMTSRASSNKSFTYQFQKSGSSQNSHVGSPAVLLLSYHVPSNEVICKTDNRMGSRRPSYSSVHSTISINSYSSRRYEREREQKEEREMQRRLSKIKGSNIEANNDLRSPDNILQENQFEVAHLAREESMSMSLRGEEIPSTSNQSF